MAPKFSHYTIGYSLRKKVGVDNETVFGTRRNRDTRDTRNHAANTSRQSRYIAPRVCTRIVATPSLTLPYSESGEQKTNERQESKSKQLIAYVCRAKIHDSHTQIKLVKLVVSIKNLKYTLSQRGENDQPFMNLVFEWLIDQQYIGRIQCCD